MLLRTRLSYSSFHLELSACLTKEFRHSRPLHSGSWGLFHREINKVPVPPGFLDIYNWCQLQRPHFARVHPPSAMSLWRCLIWKMKGRRWNIPLFDYSRLLGGPRESFWVWESFWINMIIQIMFPFFLAPSVNMCGKKKKISLTPFLFDLPKVK